MIKKYFVGNASFIGLYGKSVITLLTLPLNVITVQGARNGQGLTLKV
jgi:hypothetical protein